MGAWQKEKPSSCVEVLGLDRQALQAICCLIGFVVGGCWVIPLRFPKVPQNLGILRVPYRP